MKKEVSAKAILTRILDKDEAYMYKDGKHFVLVFYDERANYYYMTGLNEKEAKYIKTKINKNIFISDMDVNKTSYNDEDDDE